jgi:hypothetical protein
VSIYVFSSNVSLEASMRLRLAGSVRSEDPWVIVVKRGQFSVYMNGGFDVLHQKLYMYIRKISILLINA